MAVFLCFGNLIMQKKEKAIEVSSNFDEINIDLFLKRFAHFATGICCTDDTQLKIIMNDSTNHSTILTC